MAVHRKAVALMEPMEAMARLAAGAQARAEGAQTRASGSASFDNGDGTRTVIGPQTGSATMATHVGDVTPPPVPTGIRAWSGDGSLHVMWDGTLSGDVPADFDHVTILVDGAKVAEMRSAGSVTVDGLAVGSTVSVTATAEDDACLADGTPAHNVSAASTAVSVAIRDAVAEVRADADAHGEQIEAVKEDIAAYKATAEATYATKTEVDEKTGAITRTLTADYTRTADLASTEAVRDAKAAGAAAQASIDGMRLGGRNLLKGTSMDSKEVTTPTTASTTWGFGFDFPANDSRRAVIPYGAEYRCSVDVLLPVDGRIVVDMNNYAEVGTSWAGNDNDNINRRTANVFNVKANVWTRISWGSENTNDANVGKQAIYVNDGVGLLPQSADVTWHYRGLKVELGNKATGWTPAPEDTDSAVADAKKAGTDAQSQLAGYKTSVEETYAEKTELTEAVNQLSSTMTSNYSAFVDYRQSNDTAVSKAQSDATDAQSTIDSYKQSNDQAVADAKAAGTTAQDQLSIYKSSNDQAVAAAKKAGTDAQAGLDSYRSTTDQRLDELKNIADNAIESFYLKGAPSAENPPASGWTTDALRRQHAGDLYMDTDTGYSYRWSGTEWVQVKDSDVTKALREIESVKTDYATKSELTATDTELSGRVSDALTTAKSYTDSSMEQEVTNRNAAIKAQADSISLDVSRTYTRSDTFTAYQTDADGRIATANSNASTAKSTAQTAATNAATAKTDAAEAKAETKDLVTLRIDSSRGTVFKNSEVSTVLTVRCYKRGEEITTRQALRDAMDDQTARIRWWVLRAGDADWVSLADSDEKLSEDGFALTLKPSDIDIKCTFKAEIVTD